MLAGLVMALAIGGATPGLGLQIAGEEMMGPNGGIIGPDGEELVPGFQVPKEDSKTMDKLEDFKRYAEKKSWELAFKTMNQLAATEGTGMVPVGDGFFVPLRRRLAQTLATLPAEGRDAYRLFYDASAKKLWDEMKDPKGMSANDELKGLQRIASQYFLTSVGDLAADRLGDVLFEKGDFGAAEAAWHGVVRDYPDGHVPLAKVQVKRCVALSRLNRRDDLTLVAEQVKEQFGSEKLTIGGEEVLAGDFVHGLLKQMGEGPKTASTVTDSAGLGVGEIKMNAELPAWQIRVIQKGGLEKMDEQIASSGWGYYGLRFSGTVPGAAVDGKRMYVNWMGVVFAADLETGRMLWRSGKFTDVQTKALQFVQNGVDFSRFTLRIHSGKIFAATQMSGEGMAQMQCFDAETGKSLWKADKFGVGPASLPYVSGNTGYSVGLQGGETMTLVAFNVETGAAEWRLALGKLQGMQNYRGTMAMPEPAMVSTTGMLYLATNNGALLAVNTAQRRVEWAFRHDTKAILGGNRWSYDGMNLGGEAPPTLIMEGGTLYLKDSGGRSLYAMDPLTPSVKWRRPLGGEETILTLDGTTAYILGNDLSAMDLKTKKLLWSSGDLPLGGFSSRPLIGKEHIYISTARGIYDIDPRPEVAAEKRIRRIFRGPDQETSGGRLFLSGDKLISVSDTLVTAYQVDGGGVKADKETRGQGAGGQGGTVTR
jgi:outer membrane protein assembly factor BamB